MKASTKKVTELIVDELKSVIHEVITEDMESLQETFEILSDKKSMRQIKLADFDRAKGGKGSYVSWDDLKNV